MAAHRKEANDQKINFASPWHITTITHYLKIFVFFFFSNKKTISLVHPKNYKLDHWIQLLREKQNNNTLEHSSLAFNQRKSLV